MTKSAVSPTREICGLLGVHPDRRRLMLLWNDFFRRQRIDAALVYYSTKSNQLPERLSEMFHFDRRFYIIAPTLRAAIAPLLDKLEDTPDRCTFVCNEGGVLIGRSLNEFEPSAALLRETP